MQRNSQCKTAPSADAPKLAVTSKRTSPLQIINRLCSHSVANAFRTWVHMHYEVQRQMQFGCSILRRWVHREDAVALETWRDQTQKQLHKQLHLQKVLQRWQHMAIAPAFWHWKEMSDRELKLKRVCKKIIGRWTHMTLASALLRWYEWTKDQSRREYVCAKVLARWTNLSLWASFQCWIESCYRHRRHDHIVSQVLFRMQNRCIQKSFASWHHSVSKLQHMLRVSDRIVGHWVRRSMAVAFNGWVRNVDKLTSAVWVCLTLSSSFDTWYEYTHKCDNAQMEKIRQLPAFRRVALPAALGTIKRAQSSSDLTKEMRARHKTDYEIRFDALAALHRESLENHIPLEYVRSTETKPSATNFSLFDHSHMATQKMKVEVEILSPRLLLEQSQSLIENSRQLSIQRTEGSLSVTRQDNFTISRQMSSVSTLASPAVPSPSMLNFSQSPVARNQMPKSPNSPPFIAENVAGGAAISPSHMVPGVLDPGGKGGLGGGGAQLAASKDRLLVAPGQSPPSSSGSFVSRATALTRRSRAASQLPSGLSRGLFDRSVLSTSCRVRFHDAHFGGDFMMLLSFVAVFWLR